MKKKTYTITALIVTAALLLNGCAQVPNLGATDISGNSNINSGIVFVGGEFNGTEYVGQSMAHRLGFEDAQKSIVMVPGLGLSAYLYTSTPDGRNGWSVDFANNGYNTFAIDTNNLAVSGMEIKDFGTESQAKLSTWGINKIWKTWGFGDVPNQPYETTQYPVEDIEQLYASFSPKISKSQSSDSDAVTQVPKTKPALKPQDEASNEKNTSPASSADKIEVANIIALLEQQGPSVLMVHSAAGVTGFEVVRQRPDLVSALVVIEPVGSPTDEADLKEHFLSVPYLAVYGDFIESRGQTGRYESCKKTTEILNANGGFAEVVTLTDLGMQGNTHLMMQDKNNSDISKIIIDWLNEHVKCASSIALGTLS
ncbi:MAG: pimeloyl-ACP methyl ester carboxylesterase [Clostridium sp.]|jgi:pimeloyl-ACP methyl ester carboxylesterase